MSHVSHPVLFIEPDISSWTKEQATAWLSKAQPLEDDDAQVWNSLRMDGKSLPLVTPDLLLKCGMAAGPALNVVSQIQMLISQVQPSMYSVSLKYPI